MKITGSKILRRIGAVPDAVWEPSSAALYLLVVGLTAVAAHSSWLFASLGPTAYLRAKYPNSPLSNFYSVVVGHVVGLASGFVAVALFNAWSAPIVPLGEVTVVRIWASALSVALTISVSGLLRANHPPAAATTLLVALGTFKTAGDAANIIVGVLILSILSEGFIRLRDRATRAGGR